MRENLRKDFFMAKVSWNGWMEIFIKESFLSIKRKEKASYTFQMVINMRVNLLKVQWMARECIYGKMEKNMKEIF